MSVRAWEAVGVVIGLAIGGLALLGGHLVAVHIHDAAVLKVVAAALVAFSGAAKLISRRLSKNP